MYRLDIVARFHKLRPLQRFACTTILALIALAVISAFASLGAQAQTAQSPLLQPATAGPAGPIPFVIGGHCPDDELGNVLDSIVSPFCKATGAQPGNSTGWLANGLAYAQRLFTILIGIELAWSAILWVFQKEQMGELLASFIVKMMGMWFFFGVILNAQAWLPGILQSFAGLGGIVTGQPAQLDPSSILGVGIKICTFIFDNLPQPVWYTNLFDPDYLIKHDVTTLFCLCVAGLVATIIAFVVFVAFLMIAGQLIMTLIEMYIMIGAGAVMLGFTGSRWTMSFGEKYIGYCLSIGVKLFVTYVILALGLQLFPSDCTKPVFGSLCVSFRAIRTTDLGNINNLGGMILADLQIAVAAIIFMMLAQRLPGLAASMMNGSPSLTLGSAISAAQSVAGAVQGAVSAVASVPQTMVTEGAQAVVEAAALGAGGGAGGAEAAGGGGGMMSAGGEGGGGDGGDGGDSGLVKAAKSVPIAGHIATAAAAPITGTFAAAQAAISPLLNMDEGGGGGSVGVGLKIPDA